MGNELLFDDETHFLRSFPLMISTWQLNVGEGNGGGAKGGGHVGGVEGLSLPCYECYGMRCR